MNRKHSGIDHSILTDHATMLRVFCAYDSALNVITRLDVQNLVWDGDTVAYVHKATLKDGMS
jgi:hypothetical protein